MRGARDRIWSPELEQDLVAGVVQERRPTRARGVLDQLQMERLVQILGSCPREGEGRARCRTGSPRGCAGADRAGQRSEPVGDGSDGVRVPTQAQVERWSPAGGPAPPATPRSPPPGAALPAGRTGLACPARNGARGRGRPRPPHARPAARRAGLAGGRAAALSQILAQELGRNAPEDVAQVHWYQRFLHVDTSTPIPPVRPRPTDSLGGSVAGRR